MSEAIKNKIRDGFSPYLVTAKHHHRWMPYRIYIGYSYFGELCVAFAGFGLATPLSKLIADANAASNPIASSSGINALGSFSVLILFAWILTKVYIHRENLEKRCSLLSSYRLQCRRIEAELQNALREADPIPKLLVLQSKLSDLVDRSIAEDAVSGTGVNEKLQSEWEKYAETLIRLHGANWAPAPEIDRRPRNERD